MRKRLSDGNQRPKLEPLFLRHPCPLSLQFSVFARTHFEAAGKSLGKIRIRLKGEVDMKWWLFRVIGVERLLWWLRAGTKQMTFQWQSSSIGFRLFGSTMAIRFSRAIQRANVRGQNKWLFNGNPGQVKPSCWPLHGKARLRWTDCTEVCYTALQHLWQWQCICSALAVHWAL